MISYVICVDDFIIGSLQVSVCLLSHLKTIEKKNAASYP